MAIRLTVDGTIFEVDTPAEAAELYRVLARKESASKAAKARWRTIPEQTHKASDNDKPNSIAVFLWSRYPTSVSYDDVAKALGVKRTSLTPMWGHLRRWIERTSDGTLGFSDVVDKKPNPEGGGSVFRLTKTGRDFMDRVGKEKD